MKLTAKLTTEQRKKINVDAHKYAREKAIRALLDMATDPMRCDGNDSLERQSDLIDFIQTLTHSIYQTINS